MTSAKKLYLASSNPGKLKEFLAIGNVGAAGVVALGGPGSHTLRKLVALAVGSLGHQMLNRPAPGDGGRE